MARLADDIYTEGFQNTSLSDFLTLDHFRETGAAYREMRNLISPEQTNEELTSLLARYPKVDSIIRAMKKSNTIFGSDIRKRVDLFCDFVDAKQSDVELGKTMEARSQAVSQTEPGLIDRFWNTVVMNADDVYDYSRKMFEAGNRYRTQDVGVQAPLFDSLFVEFNTPGNSLFSRAGVLIEIGDRRKIIEELGPVVNGHEAIAQAFADCEWVMRYSPFFQKRKGDPVSGPVMFSYIPVAKDGSFYPSKSDPNHSVIKVSGAGYFDPEGVQTQMDQFPELESVCSDLFIAAQLAVSFAHCKNVKVSDRDPNKENEKLATKRKKKTGKGFVKFKTLEIPKMREILDALKENGKDGAKPFHIVRGHFKTYTQENPLFGSRVGQYYWATQIRGILKDGATLKDYSVSPPILERGLDSPKH